MNKANKHGQSSFEFSTTYAWALLVAAIAISGIFIFQTSDDTAERTEEKCRIGPQFECLDAVSDTEGNFEVKFRNNIDKAIYLQKILNVGEGIEGSTVQSVDLECIGMPRDTPIGPGEIGFFQCGESNGHQNTELVFAGFELIECEIGNIGCRTVCDETGLIETTISCDDGNGNSETLYIQEYINSNIVFGCVPPVSLMCNEIWETTIPLEDPVLVDQEIFDKTVNFELTFKIEDEEEEFTTIGFAELKVSEDFVWMPICDFDEDDFNIFGCFTFNNEYDCDDNDPERGKPYCTQSEDSVCEDPDKKCITFGETDACNFICENENVYCDVDQDGVYRKDIDCYNEYPNIMEYDCNDNNGAISNTPACDNDALRFGCSNTAIKEVCFNPGTCEAECVACDYDRDGENKTICGGMDICDENQYIIEPFCYSDSDCGQNEYCGSPETCEAECVACDQDNDGELSTECGGRDMCDNTYGVSKPKCVNNIECGYGGVCNLPNTCEAYCETTTNPGSDGGITLPR